jgi:hypothetical protein
MHSKGSLFSLDGADHRFLSAGVMPQIYCCGYFATVGLRMAEVICVDFPVSQGETPDEHQRRLPYAYDSGRMRRGWEGRQGFSRFLR